MTSTQLYARLLTYVRPYWKAFVAALIAMAGSSLMEPIFPAMMKFLLDEGFSKTAAPWDWLFYPAVIMAIFLARAVFGFVGDYAMSWVSNNVISELRTAMFAKMVKLPTRYYADNISGRLISRIIYDVTNVAGAASNALTALIKDAISVLGLMAWLLYLNWQLTLITLTVVPFIALVVRLFGKRLRRVFEGQQESMGELTQVLQESIEAHKVVKIFGGQAFESARFQQSVDMQRRLAMRATIAAAAQTPIVQFLAACGIAIIMGVALKQAGTTDEATVGGFVSFIIAMLMILAPLKRLADVSAPIHRGLAASESIFSLIDETPEEDGGTQILQNATGDVAFQNVSFSYPASEKPALNNISFHLKKGEVLALVGPSGSGKSTIAALLARFFNADSGQILIDGKAIDSFTLSSLRHNIALVSQDVVLFNGTIAANIAYGEKANASLEEIKNAAKAAYALEFIENLPQGFETLIGENGVKLSGGQRQRLAIARALLKNAPILILDEATSALDTESERYVQKALERLMENRSTIVIAHRLSTIENADRIITLNKGKKEEEGTHAELLSQNGLYAKLYHLQQMQEI